MTRGYNQIERDRREHRQSRLIDHAIAAADSIRVTSLRRFELCKAEIHNSLFDVIQRITQWRGIVFHLRHPTTRVQQE
jgi:hypothetical protein